MTASAVSVAGPVQLPALAYQCIRHEIQSSLALAFVDFPCHPPLGTAWEEFETEAVSIVF
jgi:hypothetical protein